MSAGYSLNLSSSSPYNTPAQALGAVATASHNPYTAPPNNWYAPGQGQDAAMNGFMTGAGIDPRYAQMPIAPPTEMEILLTMSRTSKPVERFLQSTSFPILLNLMNEITIFSVLYVLKNATFTFDEDDGVFKLDLASLSEDLQTLSPENIISKTNELQNVVNSEVTNADNERVQLQTRAEQSMLQGALNTALSDPGVIQNAAQTSGSFLRSLMTGRM